MIYFKAKFLTICFAPSYLKALAGGSLWSDFVNNPHEGYRALVPEKITKTQTQPSLANHLPGAGQMDRRKMSWQ